MNSIELKGRKYVPAELVCIARDYLRGYYDMTSAPLNQIDEFTESYLKHTEDKFKLSQFDARRRNGDLLLQAMECLYETFITDESIAKHRGEAIQAINAMAEKLGFSDIVRHD